MDAAQALADLTEISSQIQAAVLLEPDGAVAASTLGENDRAEAFARAARELVTAAEQIRSLGGESLTQLEVATGEGSVFIVRDGGRTVAATTSPEPTVGLVFYDLKSCLRSVAEEQAANGPEAKAETKPKPSRRKKAAESGAEDGDAT